MSFAQLTRAHQKAQKDFLEARECERGGSPGEYWEELMGEIETELARRMA
jgi:hypothetical protein